MNKSGRIDGMMKTAMFLHSNHLMPKFVEIESVEGMKCSHNNK